MGQPGNQPLSDLEAFHTPQAIRERLQAVPDHSDLRDSIPGAIDGTLTTFAVVSGVSRAGLAAGIVIILGAANLVTDGFSMGSATSWAPGQRHSNENRSVAMKGARSERFQKVKKKESGRYLLKKALAVMIWSGQWKSSPQTQTGG